MRWATSLSLSDPVGNVTSWAYDALGHETAQSEIVALGYNPDGSIDQTVADCSCQYDLNGNLIQSTDADGNLSTFSYDSLNEKTRETMDNGDGSVNTDSFSYDVEGNMLAAGNTYAATVSATPSTVASYTYVYDAVGNVLGQNAVLGGLETNVVLSSGYDYNGHRTSLSANIGGTMQSDGTVEYGSGTPDFLNNYVYDALGEMTSITQAYRRQRRSA